MVSLWHPSLRLSRLVELLPSFSLTLSLPSNEEGSHSGCVKQDLGCLVEDLLPACCFQWNLVSTFLPQIFFFFLTLESILLAPEVMNHPVAAPRGCPFLLPEADQGEPWS